MTFWKTENSIEPKKDFYAEIEEYYTGISNERISTELLTEIIEKVTDEIYSDYQRFWKQYPKSRKRYSKLKLADLEHDFVYYLITDFLKQRNLSDYRNLSMTLFKMNDTEFEEYEKRKHWYETK
tara:strand:- start:485 stop:856 length:372 start_codon:yes stop_codon:yes gene_type:complete